MPSFQLFGIGNRNCANSSAAESKSSVGSITLLVVVSVVPLAAPFVVRAVMAAASGSGDVVWGIQAVAISEADPLDAAFGAAQTVTDTLTTALDNHTTSFTGAVTIGGTPAEGDLVCFQVYRDADAAGDTLAVDAKLVAIRLNFTTNAADDS